MNQLNNHKTKLSDWLTYHKILIDDIQYAKNQQWRLAYYTILLLAAVFGLSKVLITNSVIVNILFLIAILLGVVGTYFLLKFQKDIKRYRQNIGKVRENFPEDLYHIAKFEKAEGKPTYYASFLILMIGVIWAGVFIVGWSLKFETNISDADKLKVETNWHRYDGRTFEVIGDNRDFVKVLSDGWKIIENLSDGDKYAWGWEISIKVLENPEVKPITLENGRTILELCSVEKIEYILFDKDGFELVRDVIKSRSLEYGSTKTFRSTSEISKNSAIRAAKSSYQISMVSKP